MLMVMWSFSNTRYEDYLRGKLTKRNGLLNIWRSVMSSPVAAEREPAFVAVGNKLDVTLNLVNELTLQLGNIEHKLFGPTAEVPPQPEEKQAIIDRGKDYVLLSYTNVLDRLHDELREAQRITSNIQRELP